ncbi:MAG: DUF87 domain-containing protein [Candidatus Obscuribacterales bacterium]
MLFADSELVGTFKGFNDRGLEFSAEIVAPYNANMLDRPQLGQFILVELASPDDAALGRITRFVPSGLLASAEGEDYVNTMQRRHQSVPEDLKEQRLKYRVQVKLLGAVRMVDGKVIYVPSQRRLPHLGARVAFPSAKVLQELCKLSQGKTHLGEFALGEFVFSGAGIDHGSPGLRAVEPRLDVTFDINNLVSRRSVIFARAGYGKSNLMKFLVSELYRESPKTRNGRDVGTLIFDPNGEYFWPDAVAGRPGLCDVPRVRDKVIVFTSKQPPSPYYGSWKVGDVKVDIRDLRAGDVISIAISPDRQQQQNVLKLKAVTQSNWQGLVDLIHSQGLQASDEDVGRLMGYPKNQLGTAAVEIAAARSNMCAVVRSLHDPHSKLLSGTIQALGKGCIVIIDLSLLSSAAGEVLAGLLLRRIFSHNQENFTGGQQILPVISIIEEAQSVLGRTLDDTSPFVEWVKEGRKYDLGAILITQQPGSMAPEILSQSDNWFCFHLLSEGDASTLGRYNSHFSNDVLAHIIAEPIPGNCFMWSAPHQPFVLPVRIRSFEDAYKGEVKSSATESRIDGLLAQDVQQEVGQALDDLKQRVLEAFKQPHVKYVEVSDGAGSKKIGVKSGQFYYLIKEQKRDADVQSEEQLKPAVMNSIFGAGTWSIVNCNTVEYYCTTEEEWRRVGIEPKIEKRKPG